MSTIRKSPEQSSHASRSSRSPRLGFRRAETRGRLLGIAQVTPLLALIVLVLGVPTIFLIVNSFRESTFLGIGPGPTLTQYQEVFGNPDTVRLMIRTITLALTVGAVVTALAFVLSYGIRFRLTGRKANIAFGVIVATGVASLIVRVFAWEIILGRQGLINTVLETAGIIGAPLEDIYLNRFATIATMVYLYLPIATLIVYSSLQNVDEKSVEASRDLGAGRWRTAATVVAPQVQVGLVSAFAAITVFGGWDFITPQLVGGTSGLTVGAAVQSIALGGGNLPGAAALAISTLLMMVGVILGIILALVAIRRASKATIGPYLSVLLAQGHRLRFQPVARFSFSRPASVLLLIYLVTPTLLVILFSFNSSSTLGLPMTGLTLDWYSRIVGTIGFSDALSGSLRITAVAILGSAMIAIPAAFRLARMKSGPAKTALWAAVYSPFVVPPVLWGAALLVSVTETDAVQQGVGLTTLAHIAFSFSIIIIVVYARLVGLDPHLNEAARELGASAWGAARRVTLPLAFPSIVGALALAAAYSLDEIFVTSFTIGTDNTLPIWLFGQARRGITPGVNALGVMLLVGTLLLFVLALVVSRRSSVGRRN
jgi:ABC-type spermidine/putrescine transport system permease subunit II